jgi:hypothetical protein
MQKGADQTPTRVEAKMRAVAMGMANPSMPDFDKPAGQRCPHQRHGKGCNVYGHHPFGCQLWNCRWLVESDTADLRRPDRAGYVIDIMPDFVTLTADGSEPQNVQVVVIWADTRRGDDWRQDEELKAYLVRRGAEGIIALIRFNEREALALIPPNMASDGKWHEVGGTGTAQHVDQGLIDGLAACRPVQFAVGS